MVKVNRPDICRNLVKCQHNFKNVEHVSKTGDVGIYTAALSWLLTV